MSSSHTVRTCHLAQCITNIVDGLSLEFESVHLEHFVPGMKLTAPLGSPAFDHSANDNAFPFIANGSALEGTEGDK